MQWTFERRALLRAVTGCDMARADQLLGSAVAQLARTWRSELDRRLSGLGLSQARWLVLLYLKRLGEAPTQTELANLLGVEGATLARLLDALEARQLVRRVAVAEDRRIKRVELLPGSEALIEQIEGIASQLTTEVVQGVDAERLRVCRSVLEQMQGNLNRLPG